MSDSPFGRQPEMVEITIKGNPIDTNNWFAILYTYLGHHAASVDFDRKAGKTTFKVYPFAVND